MAKDFKSNNPLEEMLSVHQEVSKEEAKETTIIYQEKESKTKRLNLLIRPSVYEKLKVKAEKEYMSVNELFNVLAEEYIREDK